MGYRFLSFGAPEATTPFVLGRGHVISVLSESKPVSLRAHGRNWEADAKKLRNVVESILATHLPSFIRSSQVKASFDTFNTPSGGQAQAQKSKPKTHSGRFIHVLILSSLV